MGILDALFGRSKPVPVGPERLFAMSTAQIAFEAEQQMTPTGTAGMCFKGMASGPFRELQGELEQLLKLTERDDGLSVKTHEDNLGYRWFIFGGKDFQALVTTLHVASQSLIEKGYGSQLLFALFGFKNGDGHESYWLYNYKRGTFYPFVPKRDTHDPLRQRDNAEELRQGTALEKELPIEPELERWFPVWDAPL